MKVDLGMYDKARQEYLVHWSLIDDVFYDLCEKHPGHTTRQAINAKLWLIGRTYATGIERKGKKTGQQGSALEGVAQCVFEHGGTLDEMFAQLRSIKEPLDPSKLEIITRIHGSFTALLMPALRDGQTPRSFAAKYMHFHCRAVPIYDSWAAAGLRRWRWNADFLVFDKPRSADEEYYKFVLRFWRIYQEMRQLDPSTTVRLLDRYLVDIADEHKGARND